MKTKIAVTLVFSLIAVVAWFLYNTIEFYEKDVDPVWSKKAQRNPFLAVEQFIQQQGNSIKSSNKLNILNDLNNNDVVIISDSRQIFSPKRVEELMIWMKSGGHLIVGAKISSDDEHDLLLDRFDVEKKYVNVDSDDTDDSFVERKLSELLRDANEEIKKQEEEKDREKKGEITIPDKFIAKLTFRDMAGVVRVNFGEEVELVHPALLDSNGKPYEGNAPVYWETNNAGVQFLQFDVGDGIFSVLSDAEIWQSKNIDTLDHAYLLSILTGKNSNALLLYGMQVPSFFALLKHYAPELYFSSLLWLFVWIFYRAKRFGPVRENNITTRRSLEEHLLACSTLLWHASKSVVIFRDLRTILYRKIRRQNAGFDGLKKKEQIEWLSEKCDMSKFETDRAMFENNVNDEEDFCRIVSLTQKTGNKL